MRVPILSANPDPAQLASLTRIVDHPSSQEAVLPTTTGTSIGRNVMVNMTTTNFFVLFKTMPSTTTQTSITT